MAVNGGGALERHGAVYAVGTAFVYVLLSQYGLWVTDVGIMGAFWPAAGVPLAALLLRPRETWWLILTALAAVEIANDLAHGLSIVAAASYAVGNVVQPLLAASLLTKHRPPSFARLRALLRFLALGGLLAPLAGGAIAAAGPTLLLAEPFLTPALRWLIGDGLGIMVVTPALLCFLRDPRAHPWHLSRTVVVAVGLGAVSLVVFRNWGPEWDAVLPYLIAPVLLPTALMGTRTATLAIVGVTYLGNLSLTWGYAPFGIEPAASGVVVPSFQVFLAINALSTLMLAAKVAELRDERRRTATARDEAQLERLRTTIARDALVATDIDDLRQRVTQRLGAALDAEVWFARAPGGAATANAAAPHTEDLVERPADERQHTLGDRLVVTGIPDASEALVAHRPDRPWSATERTALHAVASLISVSQARLAAEARLADANAELHAALAVRDDLLAVVSHELRTPLTPILGFAALLRTQETDLSAGTRRLLDSAERNAHRLLAVVDQLLTASDLARAQLHSSPQPVAIRELVEDLTSEVDDVDLRLLISGNPVAEVDRSHLQQILDHVLSNARKYGRPPVTVEASSTAGWVDIAVTDCGDGVPDEFVEALFDRFTQSSTGSTRNAQGLGLGLYIARRLVEHSGGTIRYAPHHPSGARFCIRIPAPASRHGHLVALPGAARAELVRTPAARLRQERPAG